MIISIACGRKRKTPKPAKTFQVGDKVLRKSDKGKRLNIGEVVAIIGTKYRVKWDANWRIGGGYLHSNVTGNALIDATELAIAEYRVEVRFKNVMVAKRMYNDWGKEWYLETLRKNVRSLIKAGRALMELKGVNK